jgi:S1-C subfamily serine protease
VLAVALTAIALAATPAQTLELTLPSIVAVETVSGNGTGFVVDQGRVITAAHVVAGAEEVRLRTAEGDVVEAAVTRLDTSTDLAVLTPTTALPGAEPLVLRTGAGQVGEPVLAVGYSLDTTTPSVSRGIVSALRTDRGTDLVQTDAAINPGMSGGPLLDDDGQVLGVVVSKLSEVEGVGLAVSASVATTVLAGDQHTTANSGEPVSAPFGVTTSDPVPWAGLVVVAGAVAVAVGLRRRRADGEIEIHLGPGRPTLAADLQQKESV